MDRKEKQAKKSFISEAIDLANGRYKDEEVDSLYDLVENRSKYDGTARTYKHSFDSWCSDGKYTSMKKRRTLSEATKAVSVSRNIISTMMMTDNPVAATESTAQAAIY